MSRPSPSALSTNSRLRWDGRPFRDRIEHPRRVSLPVVLLDDPSPGPLSHGLQKVRILRQTGDPADHLPPTPVRTHGTTVAVHDHTSSSGARPRAITGIIIPMYLNTCIDDPQVFEFDMMPTSVAARNVGSSSCAIDPQ